MKRHHIVSLLLCLPWAACVEGTQADQASRPTEDEDSGGLTDSTSDSDRVGMATHFDAMGSPTGGCGVPESLVDTPYYVALNTQHTPGDYGAELPRPIADSAKLGEFANGRNCGRWVRVTIDDWCSATNDGAPNQPFCHGGADDAWVADEFNGATLDMLVADSCADNNAWCRDDRYHLDLRTSSLTAFTQGGTPVPDLIDHWNNRRISWRYIDAPGYSGDIEITFIPQAQQWWAPVLLTHLPRGISAVEQLVDGAWTALEMADNAQGQQYKLDVSTHPHFELRVTSADGTLLHGGRVYVFEFPAACGELCSDFTPVSYTTY